MVQSISTIIGEAEAYDFMSFNGCLLDTGVELDSVEVLSPVKSLDGSSIGSSKKVS